MKTYFTKFLFLFRISLNSKLKLLIETLEKMTEKLNSNLINTLFL